MSTMSNKHYARNCLSLRHVLLAGCCLTMVAGTSVHAESWASAECTAVYQKTGAIPLSPKKSPPLNKTERKIFFNCCWKAFGGDVNMSNWYCLNSPNALSKRIPTYCGSPESSCMPDLGEFCLPTDKKFVCALRKLLGKLQECVGNPCDPLTGNKLETSIDYRSANGQLDVIRYYNSLSPKEGIFGYGWTSSLVSSLVIDASTAILHIAVQQPDGYGEVWKKNKGNWKSEPDSKLLLLESKAGFVVNFPDGSIQQYDANGKLLKKTDRNRLTIQYLYDKIGNLNEIIDSYSRKLLLTYNQDNRISKIVTPDGQFLYDYDAQGNLIKVTYPDNTAKQYLYGEEKYVSSAPEPDISYAHALTGLVDENNVRLATWSYDKRGKVASSEHAGGVEKVTLEYKDSSTVVTEALGGIRTYQTVEYFSVPKVESISGDSCSDCGSGRMKSRTYDKNGNLASSTDAKGNLTCYLHDLKRNLEIIRLEGLPKGKSCPKDLAAYNPPAAPDSTERKITIQWHEKFRLPVAVAEPLRLSLSTYDEEGRLTAQAVQATTDINGGAGLKAEKIGAPRTTSYIYNAAGQIESIDGPRTDVADKTSYSYDSQGNLTSVTNALNQITKLGDYDPSGRPRSITDPNGFTTTLSYDLRGRLKSIKKGGEETGYTYDKAGNLTKISLPGGVAYTYVYDPAHRLTDIQDQDGNGIHFTLDKAGNRLKEEIKDRSGKALQSRSREFNKLSRLVKEIGAVNQTVSHEYDENGNLLKITDPLSRTVSNQYDALNRLIVSTDPDGKPTHYSYDGQDQLVWVTDPRNLGTQYVRDGLNNLSKTVSPDAGTTTATFDEAGNIKTRVDAKGQEAKYSYDALSRLTSISYTGVADQNITYSYDQGQNGIGRLTSIKDVTGTVEYSYDQHGRLLREKRQSYGSTYITTYSYDAQGRLNRMTYPSGRTVEYSFDSQGRIEKISTSFDGETKTVASGIRYQPFGGVLEFTFGNGQKYSREYDQDGRITGYTLADAPYNIAYDAASQITGIKGEGNTAQYAYDLLGRLTRYTQGSDLLQSFSYDPVGNRLRMTEGSVTTNYTYPTTSNRLIGIEQSGQAAKKKITYDPNGSMTEDQKRQYAYDVKGRLMKTTTEQGEVEYSVNAVGLRIRKKSADSDTVYHYDNQGRLIAEGATGGTVFSKEYIYLGDQPVAVLQ